MSDKRIRWTKAAKATGGLGAVFTLLAHFWLPSLPLTAIRVEILLVLIAALLGLDMLTDRLPVETKTEQPERERQD